jgi:hypothetical protein
VQNTHLHSAGDAKKRSGRRRRERNGNEHGPRRSDERRKLRTRFAPAHNSIAQCLPSFSVDWSHVSNRFLQVEADRQQAQESERREHEAVQLSLRVPFCLILGVEPGCCSVVYSCPSRLRRLSCGRRRNAPHQDPIRVAPLRSPLLLLVRLAPRPRVSCCVHSLDRASMSDVKRGSAICFACTLARCSRNARASPGASPRRRKRQPRRRAD